MSWCLVVPRLETLLTSEIISTLNGLHPRVEDRGGTRACLFKHCLTQTRGILIVFVLIDSNSMFRTSFPLVLKTQGK